MSYANDHVSRLGTPDVRKVLVLQCIDALETDDERQRAFRLYSLLEKWAKLKEVPFLVAITGGFGGILAVLLYAAIITRQGIDIPFPLTHLLIWMFSLISTFVAFGAFLGWAIARLFYVDAQLRKLDQQLKESARSNGASTTLLTTLRTHQPNLARNFERYQSQAPAA